MSRDIGVDDMVALDLEYRLTIAVRLGSEGGAGCDCVRYLIRRREALLPHVLMAAIEQDRDPLDVFANFARGLHARHEASDDVQEATS